MDAYHALAASYDRLTNDVDYRATVDFYFEILKKEGIRPRTAVDLACGTGSGSVAAALWMQGKVPGGFLTVKNPGGDLAVTIEGGSQVEKLLLEGPAETVTAYQVDGC